MGLRARDGLGRAGAFRLRTVVPHLRPPLEVLYVAGPSVLLPAIIKSKVNTIYWGRFILFMRWGLFSIKDNIRY